MKAGRALTTLVVLVPLVGAARFVWQARGGVTALQDASSALAERREAAVVERRAAPVAAPIEAAKPPRIELGSKAAPASRDLAPVGSCTYTLSSDAGAKIYCVEYYAGAELLVSQLRNELTDLHSQGDPSVSGPNVEAFLTDGSLKPICESLAFENVRLAATSLLLNQPEADSLEGKRKDAKWSKKGCPRTAFDGACSAVQMDQPASAVVARLGAAGAALGNPVPLETRRRRCGGSADSALWIAPGDLRAEL